MRYTYYLFIIFLIGCTHGPKAAKEKYQVKFDSTIDFTFKQLYSYRPIDNMYYGGAGLICIDTIISKGHKTIKIDTLEKAFTISDSGGVAILIMSNKILYKANNVLIHLDSLGNLKKAGYANLGKDDKLAIADANNAILTLKKKSFDERDTIVGFIELNVNTNNPSDSLSIKSSCRGYFKALIYD
ncbi:MAG: hypothetical protein J7604_21575 [Sporocytophaga sp.]|uniref:hypothetical protein n=1 Tax=Sporocytophaga sp. TaxID=2231183 RepID=UPI001B00D330|nr:hypothetical protein [Sporocytophaga sp.]MBO9702818.1 hypothetical protein [Sporocytophaga sp.]